MSSSFLLCSGHQTVAGLKHRVTDNRRPRIHTPTVNLAQHACLQTARGGCSIWRRPTQTYGDNANSTQKGPSQDLSTGPSRCEAKVPTTVPLL